MVFHLFVFIRLLHSARSCSNGGKSALIIHVTGTVVSLESIQYLMVHKMRQAQSLAKFPITPATFGRNSSSRSWSCRRNPPPKMETERCAFVCRSVHNSASLFGSICREFVPYGDYYGLTFTCIPYILFGLKRKGNNNAFRSIPSVKCPLFTQLSFNVD